MSTSFGALCNDFYVNSRLNLKLDLPGDRETILHLCDRVAKSIPSMDHFHRYEEEIVLESNRRETEYRWMSLRRNSVRTGHVNPDEMELAYQFHRLVLELVPYHLSISPLDVDYVEMAFGFDLECKGNHDEVIYEALYGNSPLGDLLKVSGAQVLDMQPIFGMTLSEKGDTQASFQIKTRPRSRRGASGKYADEPISLFVTCRQYGPIRKLEEINKHFERLRRYCETLAAEKLVPHLLKPISRQITSSNA